MKSNPPTLLPILRSEVQGHLLARVLLHPDRAYSLSELATMVGTSLPTAKREVDRAERAGIVRSTRIGRTRQVTADPASPLHDPLRDLLVLTFGPATVLADELAPIAGIDQAYLFGSWAARLQGEAGAPPRDVDVLVVGDPDRRRLDALAERLESSFGRPVQVVVRSRRAWDLADEPFVQEVRGRPLLPLIEGDGDDVGTGTGRGGTPAGRR